MLLKKSEKANSILELMIYLLISSIILVITNTNLQSIFKEFNKHKNNSYEYLKIKRVESFLYKESLRDQEFLGVKKFVWHRNALNYKSLYPNRKINTENVNPNSLILESITTITSLFYNTGDTNRYAGIIKINDIVNKKNLKFLAINLYSTSIIDSDYDFRFIKKDYWNIYFKNTNTNYPILLSSRENKPNNDYPVVILPVQDYFILYTDIKNSLRRLSLINNSNQPIEEDILITKLDEETCEIRSLKNSFEKSIKFKCINSETSILDRANLLDG